MAWKKEENSFLHEKDVVDSIICNVKTLSSVMDSDKTIDFRFELSCVKQAAFCLPTKKGSWSRNCKGFYNSGPQAFLIHMQKFYGKGAEKWYLDVHVLRALGMVVNTEDDFEHFIQPRIDMCHRKGGNHAICLAIVLRNFIENPESSLRRRAFQGRNDKDGLVHLIEWEPEGIVFGTAKDHLRDARCLAAQYLWKLASSDDGKNEEFRFKCLYALRSRNQNIKKSLIPADRKWLDSQLQGLEEKQDIPLCNTIRAQSLLARRRRKK